MNEELRDGIDKKIKAGDLLLAHLRSINFYNKLPVFYTPPDAYWDAFGQINKN